MHKDDTSVCRYRELVTLTPQHKTGKWDTEETHALQKAVDRYMAIKQVLSLVSSPPALWGEMLPILTPSSGCGSGAGSSMRSVSFLFREFAQVWHANGHPCLRCTWF